MLEYEDGDLSTRLKGGLLPSTPPHFLLSDRMSKNSSTIESREVKLSPGGPEV